MVRNIEKINSAFFVGNIPPSIGDLTDLTHLDLSDSALNGIFFFQ
jgi:hypothetical protein